ncbi:hypothetical protein TcasGA2_TC033433 [Tribolium castaneum]|uniref:Uncharacterized protein n=1 Tax=Tribolium castaneum TaxID=7070 RepID=A0A139WFV0_TRICA|nr:hypothetical protein TcasGA2_TC033433 [Tribolium castaneum]
MVTKLSLILLICLACHLVKSEEKMKDRILYSPGAPMIDSDKSDDSFPIYLNFPENKDVRKMHLNCHWNNYTEL